MPAEVILTVTQGALQGQQFVFDQRTACILGKEADCHLRFPKDRDHHTISRHHCLLDINPPDIRVRDCGSRNGTYVNGHKIGQRPRGQTPEQGARLQLPEHDLQDGDEVKVGRIVFRVSVFVPAVCADCAAEIPEEHKARAQRTPDVYQCEACRLKAEASRSTEPAGKKDRVCTRCGQDVSREMGVHRRGEFICAACRADPERIMKRLLELARSGTKNLLAIQGYDLVRELGRGGMGAVYLARHEKTRELAALKVMLPQVALNERAKQLFLREIENTRALRHRHVVELRDAGCEQGTFFMVLEYCDGGSVDRLMQQRGGTLSVPEAGRIILQALAGLEYAHDAEIPNVQLADGSTARARGLVHRDLKPHNIFLSGSGRSSVAKVGDYGLAKAFDLAGLSGQTWTGSAGGTPYFLPRQQVANFRLARPEVDVWAMAASLYFMLTGRPPRHFRKGRDPWRVVLQTDAIPIRRRDATIPRKLAEVIDQALVDKPEIQFKKAAEFRRALERVL
jgi:hypothetical protein